MKHRLILLHLCVWIFVALVLFSHVDAHVIGVDFGTEYIKVAGPHGTQNLDIVLNEYSQRKTSNYIAQRHGDWHIGDHAQNIAARFPLNYACGVNELLGLHVNSNNSITEEHFTALSYKYRILASERGTALVPLEDFEIKKMNSSGDEKIVDKNYDNSVTNSSSNITDNDWYSAEELCALMLKHLNKMAINDGVLAPSNIVVTIPFHTPLRTRRAIVDAAEMAGVKVSALVPHTMAAAFYYGVRHRGFEEETVNVIIFDIGASHVEAGLYQFTPPARLSSTKGTNSSFRTKRQRNVLSSYFGTLSALAVFEDQSVGGRALDLCVANMIEEAAHNSLHIEPILNGSSSSSSASTTAVSPSSLQSLKAHFSLLRAAKKTRETLSSNSYAFYVVEGITHGKDFHGKLTRVEYETRCKHVLDKFTQIAAQVWNVAREKKLKVSAFEMIGGVTRTPRVLQDFANVIGRSVDRTLNSDEAAALGAAYVAVRDSPFYNVKSFAMHNTTHADTFFYTAKSVDEKHEINQNLSLRKRLIRGKDAASHKTITLTFSFTHNFDIEIYSNSIYDNAWHFTNDINDAHSINDDDDDVNSNLIDTNTQVYENVSTRSSDSQHDVNASLLKRVDKLAKVNLPPVAVIKVTQVHEALTRLRFFDLEDNRSNKTHIVRLHVKVTDAGLIEIISASVVMHYTVAVEYKSKNATSGQQEGDNYSFKEHNVTATANNDEGSRSSSNISSNNDKNTKNISAPSQEENINYADEQILRKNNNESSHEHNYSSNDNNSDGGVNNVSNSIPKNVKVVPKSKSARVYAEISWLSPREVSDEEMLKSKRKMERIEAEEHAKREKALARNNLEAYIFWMKNDGILQNEEVKAASPADLLERATKHVMEAHDWLENGDGSKESCTLLELEEKLNELTVLGNELLEYAKEIVPITSENKVAVNDTVLSSAQKQKQELRNKSQEQQQQEDKEPEQSEQEQHKQAESELKNDEAAPDIGVETDL